MSEVSNHVTSAVYYYQAASILVDRARLELKQAGAEAAPNPLNMDGHPQLLLKDGIEIVADAFNTEPEIVYNGILLNRFEVKHNGVTIIELKERNERI